MTFQMNKGVNAVTGATADGHNNQVYLRGNWVRCLDSVTIEINNSCSVSYRNSELSEILDDVFCHPLNMRDDPEGVMNDFLGRDQYRLGIPMLSAAQAAVPQTQMTRVDRNAAERRRRVPATAANTDIVIPFVHDLQIPGLFSGKWRMGKEFGNAGSQSKWLPYMDTISLTLIFKNSADVGRELFQCPSYQLAGNAGGNSYHSVGNIPTVQFTEIGDCYADVRYVEPSPSYSLPAQTNYVSPRFVSYSKEGTLKVKAGAGTAAEKLFRASFSQIRLEASPLYFLIYCSIRDGAVGRNAATGMAWDSERFSLYQGTTSDSRAPGVLQITSSAAGGLTQTLGARTLYEITKKNQRALCPGKRCLSWSQWNSGGGCYILLSPDDLGQAFPPASVFAPSVLSCEVSWENTMPVNAATGGSGAAVPVECKLLLLYADNLVISSGSASVSSTMVAASALKQAAAPAEREAPGIEALSVQYPGQQ